MNTQPQQGRQNPFPHTNTAIRSILQSPKTPRNTKRLSRKAAEPPRGSISPFWNPPDSAGSKSARSHFTSDVFAARQTHGPAPLRGFACPPPARNSFSRRDAEPAEVGIPSITAFLDARGGAAQTRDQGSGVGNEGACHLSTAAGGGPVGRPIHPDHSKWNCSSNAMAGCSGPSTDFYGSLPLTRHGHRCPSRSIVKRTDLTRLPLAPS
jgi:hypothetical protein